MNDEREDTPQPAVRIPPEALEAETLRRLLESFVLREGTEYGPRDFSLAEKVDHVLAQLHRREAAIYFDPNTETVDIRRLSGRDES